MYISSQGRNSVMQLDSSAGLLTFKDPLEVPTGENNARYVSITPDGKNVYATNAGSNRISQYSVGANGTLTAKSTSSLPAGTTPWGIAITPDGKSAYVASFGSGQILQYSIGADGSLTFIGMDVAGTNPVEIAITPDGKYAYATAYGNGQIYQYAIGPDGSLEPHTTLSVGGGVNPWSISITPDGKSVYVIRNVASGNNVFHFKVENDGSLNFQSNIPAGDQPQKGVVSPNGKNLYVANFNENSISQYTIGTNGALSSNGSVSTGAATSPTDIVFPDAKSLYVLNYGGKSISQFNIGADGLLTPKDISPAQLGINTDPTAAVLSPAFDSVARFGVSGVTESGQNIVFDASASDGGDVEAYDWDFGDGQTATAPEGKISHVYTKPGTYNVKLTLRLGGCPSNFVFTGQTAYCNKQGNSSLQASETITVNQAPLKPTPPPVVQCVVPKLLNITLKSAKKKLVASNCALGKVSKPKRKPRKAKKLQLVVVKQSRNAGVKLAKNTKVNLTLKWKKVKKKR